jgi:hypothetical protein
MEMSLELRFRQSPKNSSPVTLSRVHVQLIDKLRLLFPGSTPRLQQRAVVDVITLQGVSSLTPTNLHTLQKIARFDYQLSEDHLLLYISRKQRSVTKQLFCGSVFLVLGALCLLLLHQHGSTPASVLRQYGFEF